MPWFHRNINKSPVQYMLLGEGVFFWTYAIIR